MLLQLKISCLQEKAGHWRNVERGGRVREHPTLQTVEAFLSLSAVRRSREVGHQFVGRNAASRLLRDPHVCFSELGAPLMAISSTTLRVRQLKNTSDEEFFSDRDARELIRQ